MDMDLKSLTLTHCTPPSPASPRASPTASRLVGGLTSGNISVARAYIADVSPEARRSRNLGLVGAAFGLGFVAGPALGGYLSSTGSHSLAASVSAALVVLELLVLYFCVPEPPERKVGLTARPIGPAMAVEMYMRPRLGPLLRLRLVVSGAFLLFHTTIILHSRDRLGLTTRQSGYLLSYVGMLVGLVQGGLLRVLLRRWDEASIARRVMHLSVPCLLFWAHCPSPAWLLLAVALLCACKSRDPILESQLTREVGDDEFGLLMGVITASDSLMRIITSSLGGFLLQHAGTWAPGTLAALVTALAAFAGRHIAAGRLGPGKKKDG